MAKRTLAIGLGMLLALAALAGAQTWTRLTNLPSIGASTSLLLTDGTVMVQAVGSGIWWRLTPDITGSYVNGTWTVLASMPAGYGPLYYGSAVLPDGRVVVEGGEYNNFQQDWTPMGAIYDPIGNTWTSITAPAGWSNIGDAQSVVLPNGTFMMANPFTEQTALLNAATLTWTSISTGKVDANDEEGWTLLPSGKVLTVDTNNPADLTHSEIYDPATGAWSSAGSTIVKLPDTNADGSGSHEIGPAVLRPDGTVFATGGTSNTAIYNSALGTWSAGPAFLGGLDVADGPAALLPDGHVLVDASPGVFNSPSQFFEFDGTNLPSTSNPPRASGEPSYVGRLLVLPTGQILFTDGSTDVEVYTASGTYESAWQPTIASSPTAVLVGEANKSLTGTQLNGLSQGAAYGDDAQVATNYPLVRITNNATGHVSYARTHNHSTMAVATGSTLVSTEFDVPVGIETGASTLQVVANGIPSSAAAISVLPRADGVGWVIFGGSGTSTFHHNGVPSKVSFKTRVDVPITGDWNGQGSDTPGGYVRSTSTFDLRYTNTDGNADLSFVFGTPGAGWKPIVGDWNGDGVDTIGLYDPATGTFHLRNSNTAGPDDITFTFTGAAATWLPIAGDWNGDGIVTVGLYDPATSTFYLRNSNTTGSADITFVFGTPGAGLLPVAGDWDGNGADSIGVYNPTTFLWSLKNVNAAGPPDIQITYGAAGAFPITGRWGGF
ncbi:MAG TPA: VCBS repeat-containing protein [Thermoanaerobaculia bacterium]|nr:VCBS repeat-containing protein [Thermoanaerobaculia bacterium]